MSTTTQQSTSKRVASSDHLSVRPEGDGPVEVRFLFEQQEKRLGGALGASVLSHVAFVAIALLIANFLPERTGEAILPDVVNRDIVWLTDPGPGGGGGGGNSRPEPPKKAEMPGPDKITVPAVKPPEPTPVEPPKVDEPPPLEPQMNIPAIAMAAGTTTVPGVIESDAASDSVSTGSGSGTGAGAGQGSGLGEGSGGGTGGGVYRIGSGVESPRLLRSVRPNYTSEAMRAKVQGIVRLEGIVLADGTVGDVRVLRSLDAVFGLDDEAIKAAKQFRFAPGTRFGQPVSVIVSFEIEFTLR
ncbi:MAG TPA: TonB family protein [Vicinamibacterales bacterium]